MDFLERREAEEEEGTRGAGGHTMFFLRLRGFESSHATRFSRLENLLLGSSSRYRKRASWGGGVRRAHFSTGVPARAYPGIRVQYRRSHPMKTEETTLTTTKGSNVFRVLEQLYTYIKMIV